MTDFSSRPSIGADTAAEGSDVDGRWWGEPDPVQVFAAGLELALRQLRVEVAGLRAERDGLRLEVEGLRAKLMLAQEQVVTRDGLSDVVRQLQAAVARLTAGEASRIEAPPLLTTTPQPSILVLPTDLPVRLESFLPPFPPPPVPTPTPTPAAVASEPVSVDSPAPETADPSAIAQLEAMGAWPKAEPVLDNSSAPAVSWPEREPVPVPVSSIAPDLSSFWGAPAAPPAPSEPRPPVVSWDQMSTRRTPALIVDRDGDGPRFEPVVDEVEPERRSLLRGVRNILLGVVAAVAVLVVLAVSVGPRFLPYQTYFVRSGSMAPTIATGAMVVLTKTDASALGRGDIITFNEPGDPDVKVTHRIVDVETTDEGRVFVTKGDANAEPDAWRVPATGTGWKYSFNVPLVGYVFGSLGTPKARIALLVVPALVLGLLALVDVRKPKKRPKRNLR